jgi:hypothetical protein
LGLSPAILAEFEQQFRQFVLNNMGNPRIGVLHPSVADTLLKAGKIDLRVLRSDSQWHGVTYSDDKEKCKPRWRNWWSGAFMRIRCGEGCPDEIDCP